MQLQNKKDITNPSTAGLAGFGLSSLFLQFFNLGLISEGPALYIGAIFGGLVQLFVGFQYIRLHDSFGYAVFISYGTFWLTLPIILISNHFNLFFVSSYDIGILLLFWALLSVLYMIISFYINTALSFLFVFIVLGKFTSAMTHLDIVPLEILSAILFIIAGMIGWYIMTSTILKEYTSKNHLPLGHAFIKSKEIK